MPTSAVATVVTGPGTGCVPYAAALAEQRRIHAAVADGGSPNRLLLLEHESVYTAGVRTHASEWPLDGSPVVRADRGGKLTWHGPGQLIGYPILRLPRPVDVVAYVRRLEDLLVGVVADLGIPARRVAGQSGVWVERPDHPPRADGSPWRDKIAAIGVRVAREVTMHGFALNCSNSLRPYEQIVACGVPEAGVTTISRELGRTVSPAGVAPMIGERFEEVVVAPARPRDRMSQPARTPTRTSAQTQLTTTGVTS